MPTLIVTSIFFTLVPGPASAHGSDAHGTTMLWTFDPWIVTPLLVSALFYAAGLIRLWSHSGFGRGLQLWQVATYGAGWLMLVLALLSPLHWVGERLFTAHMIEHEIVMAVAAPLIAISRPVGAFLWAWPKAARCAARKMVNSRAFTACWHVLTAPLNATILHGVAIWLWHAPALFDAAVTNVAIHRLQHLTFLVTALLFWWALIRRSNYGAAVAHLFITMLHTTVLGALMALAPRVLYAAQTANAAPWGFTALQDQQLAGIIMWVPAGTVYAGAAFAFAALWIKHSSQAAVAVSQEQSA